MSRATKSVRSDRQQARVFAALGDPTRLHLVGRLAGSDSLSLTQLAAGTRLSRQAVSKHLRVLAEAALVGSEQRGRETRFRFVPAAMKESCTYLQRVGAEWDEALARLKAFVET